MRLSGKTCLITGAGNGIGRGLALGFAQEGAAIGVLDIDGEAAQRVTTEIIQSGGRAVALAADVADSRAVSEAVRALRAQLGVVHILVHNAAIMPIATLDRTSEEDWDRVFAVNVKGAYLTSRELIPQMREAGGGSIIFTASVSGMLGMADIPAYTATKGALISMARAMAIDHAREGIRVNTISPGTINSPMFNRCTGGELTPEELQTAAKSHNPLGRVGTVEDIVGVFLLLASEQASFVTGANYTVDGGLSIQCARLRDTAKT